MGRIKVFDRIRTTKEFNAVYRKADKIWHTPWFVLFYKKSTEYHVGFVASKKVGNAVHRNRAKRLLRAHFISHIDQIKTGHYILVAKHPILDNSYHKISKTFTDVLIKCKLLNTPSS
ncbi:MAG: ribonuclease P protein component [Sulfurovum sp.]|nr:ribonuclease P protein component [Sulfurovum sp.]